MTNTNQGLLQEWLRGQTGKALDFNGDMLAFLKSKGYSTSLGLNGALIKYLKAQLSLTNNENISLNDLQYRFAISKGVPNWNGVTELNA